MAQIVPGTDIDSAFVTLGGKRRTLGEILSGFQAPQAPQAPDGPPLEVLVAAEVSRQLSTNHAALEAKIETLLNTINTLAQMSAPTPAPVKESP